MLTGPHMKGIEVGDVVQLVPADIANPAPAGWYVFGFVREVHPHGATVVFRASTVMGAVVEEQIWRWENVARVGRAPFQKQEPQP